jgi:hypothetical protein
MRKAGQPKVAQAPSKSEQDARELLSAVEGHYVCVYYSAERSGKAGPEPACESTLAVCPASICAQWRSEIERHAAASVRVLVNDGVRAIFERADRAVTSCSARLPASSGLKSRRPRSAAQ